MLCLCSLGRCLLFLVSNLGRRVRQGGVLIPVLFALYMDVLIRRLRNAGFACQLLNEFYGCILYADDILLSVHSLNAVQHMLRLAEQFAVEFDVKYNSNKSVVMRIGSRYKTICVPLFLARDKLKFVTSVRYLGICIKAFIYFKCMVEA